MAPTNNGDAAAPEFAMEESVASESTHRMLEQPAPAARTQTSSRRGVSIRCLSIVLNVVVVGVVSVSLILVSVRTGEVALQSCEETMEQSVDAALMSGEINVQQVTGRLMDRSMAHVVAEIHAYLAPQLLFLRRQATFAQMYGLNNSQNWAWMSEVWRPTLWNEYKALFEVGGTGVQVLSLGGNPRTPGRTSGPMYMFMSEDQDTVARPRTPEYFHYLYVTENNGSAGFMDWGRLPHETASVKVDPGSDFESLPRPTPETACIPLGSPDHLGRIDLSPLPAPEPGAEEVCEDTLASSPGCKYGGMCDCVEATADHACGTVPEVGGFPFDVSANCKKTCNECGGTPPPPPCEDTLASSPACKYGGMCDCVEATAEHACGTVPEIGGFPFDVTANCQATCGCGSLASLSGGADRECMITRAVDTGANVPLGPDCCFEIGLLKWTFFFDQQLRTMLRTHGHPPDGQPYWKGLSGVGGPVLNFFCSVAWHNEDAWDDPAFGNRAGMIGANVAVATLSDFLRGAALPEGYRMYIYDSGTGGSDEMKGVSIAVSDGDAFVVIRKKIPGIDGADAYKLLNQIRHFTNATDPVINASANWVASAGPNAFSTDLLYMWPPTEGGLPAHHLPPNDVRYFMKIQHMTDEARLSWNMVVLVPRAAILAEIDRASAETKARIKEEEKLTEQEQEENYMIMYIIASAVFIFATTLVTYGWEVLLAVQMRQVRDNMLLLGEMKPEEALEQHSEQHTGSKYEVGEVQDLNAGFVTAARFVKEWRDNEIARRVRLEEERRLGVIKAILTAEENAQKLIHPMVLHRAHDFLSMGKLKSYETLRDSGAGKVMFLDTEDGLQNFRKHNNIIFLSHQWLAWGTPDPENIHYRCMVQAIKHTAPKLADKGAKSSGKDRLNSVYVWVDYCSIAQEHRGMQLLAVSSLPVWASQSDAFVVIAPQATHSHVASICSLTSYNLRGWCRAEMLAKVCGSGLDGFYVHEKMDGDVVPVTAAFLERLSLRVFEGDFSCCTIHHRNTDVCDKETLMTPVLGLYAMLLKLKKDFHSKGEQIPPHLAPVFLAIEVDKLRFFPRRFEFIAEDSAGGAGLEAEDRELFGSLIDEMEGHIEEPQRMHEELAIARQVMKMEPQCVQSSIMADLPSIDQRHVFTPLTAGITPANEHIKTPLAGANASGIFAGVNPLDSVAKPGMKLTAGVLSSQAGPCTPLKSPLVSRMDSSAKAGKKPSVFLVDASS